MLIIGHSVAEFLPDFQGRVREALNALLGDAGEKRIKMGLAKDGSGVGGMSCCFHIRHNSSIGAQGLLSRLFMANHSPSHRITCDSTCHT